MTGSKRDGPAGGGRDGFGVAYGICRCPNCGYERARSPTVPCYAMRCPRCDSPMTEL